MLHSVHEIDIIFMSKRINEKTLSYENPLQELIYNISKRWNDLRYIVEFGIKFQQHSGVTWNKSNAKLHANFTDFNGFYVSSKMSWLSTAISYYVHHSFTVASR